LQTTLQGNIDANATADSTARALIQQDVDQNEADSDEADSTHTADIAAEILRATTREDSIIDALYWNQAVAGTLSLDAGITDVELSSTVVNADRDAGVVFKVYDSNSGNAMSVNADGSVFVEDLNVNNSLNLSGNVTAEYYTTIAGDPIADSHLARKKYVDDQIDAATGAANVFDYAATASTINNSIGGNLIYYLNGANLFYKNNTGGDGSNASNGYTITVYGTGMDQISSASLYLRGQSVDLVANNNWASSGDGSATFSLTYQNLLDLSGGNQTDGVMRCHLVVDGKNSGLTFKFHLDSTSSAAQTTSFD